MNHCTIILLTCLGGCLVVPLVDATQLSLRPKHATANVQLVKSKVCFSDVFSGPLPGNADYCLGMRNWSKGQYRSSLEYLKLAAAWGNKNAQYTLGLIHYGGHHVPINVALGMAWLKLADERHNDAQIARVTRSAARWATPRERARAQQLFRRMLGKYGDKVAAARAWHRLQHWRDVHDRRNSGCVRVYGAEAAAVRRMGLAGLPPPSIHALLVDSHGKPIPAQNAGACITLQMRRTVTQHMSEQYFAGTPWAGTVTVGPLRQMPAPAASSGG